MNTDGVTFDEFNTIVGVMLRNLRLSGAVETGATPIKEIATACGFAPSTLLKECRADVVEHVDYHGSRAMTPTQVAKFLQQYSRGGKLASRLKPERADEMAQAREASAKAAARAPRRSRRRAA